MLVEKKLCLVSRLDGLLASHESVVLQQKQPVVLQK